MSRNLESPPWEAPSRTLDGRAGLIAHTSYRPGPRGYLSTYDDFTRPKSGLTRRGLVYEYVRAHPGIHVRGMAKDLGIGTGDLQYHLFWLEKYGYVKTKKSGFYRFVYPTMMFKESQEVLLGVLSQETPREILLSLIRSPTMTQGDLARALAHSQPTISWHMERLVRMGLVSKSRTKKGVIYEVVADREDVLSLVRTYHPGAWRRWAGSKEGAVAKDRPAQGMALMPPAVVEAIGHS
ncbi:MAG TPA: winged helix-turn-helix transcriptional regulator [Nitrososphaerales archaeon]|nr:winged helix-turn-helix transcriptional regulator [Nitrososphaerales archaeon]